MGVESGDQNTLDLVKKGTRLAQIRKKTRLVKKHSKIKIIGFFIIGFPHERMRDIIKTIWFSLRLPLNYATFTIFTPFPGTLIFEEMVKGGALSLQGFRWEDLLLDRTTFKHQHVSKKRLKGLQRLAYIAFYARPSKLPFFFRVLLKESSFKSYLKRFLSILGN